MIVVLLGPPGAGKGTVAQRIEEKLGLPQLSSGDVLREVTKSGTPRGDMINQLMLAGKLVPDETITELIREKMEQSKFKKGVILDGYPRTLMQAQLLDRMLKELHKKVNVVILLDLDDDEIIWRLTSRTQCPNCNKVYGIDVPPKKEGVCDKCGADLYQRKDEQEKIIRHRIKIYKELTSPLIEFYREKKLLKEVNADKTVKGVMKQVFEFLE